MGPPRRLVPLLPSLVVSIRHVSRKVHLQAGDEDDSAHSLGGKGGVGKGASCVVYEREMKEDSERALCLPRRDIEVSLK